MRQESNQPFESPGAALREDFLPKVQDGLAYAHEARLWPALTTPTRSRRPVWGVDIFGERVGGWWRRRKMGRLNWKRASAIMAHAGRMRNHSEAALDDAIHTARSLTLTDRDGAETINHAYAVMYEVVRREIGLSLHPEQVLGALALAQGCCVELATGEGKTVTAILPTALEGWTGRGVHVITVNDYLAKRDAQNTSPAYTRLGISVGVLQDSTSHENRRKAYAADVTYSADKQIIFDHLRDRLSSPLSPRLTGMILDRLTGPRGLVGAWASTGLGGEGRDSRQQRPDANWMTHVVQRGYNAAIIDEADSVLIDEAATPAIISMPGESRELAACLEAAAKIAARWRSGEQYIADDRLRSVALTPKGREELANVRGELPEFWSGPRRREELLVQALTAKELYKQGVDYVISDKKVMIVDRSTGRILPGRQWQLGLHQAVEAKEHLEISAPSQVAARTSYQGFFQRYRRLCGMTGTAQEVCDELWRWYRLPVVQVPTHKPVARKIFPDRIFDTQESKLRAAALRVEELVKQGRPVLVGAWSVTTSETVSQLLTQRGVAHSVLNATKESEEAAIIERAGQVGAVTVATNMAGRGTDIQLSPEARAAGGLAVVATERHDEARVDRQLAGRAGRQGDPGSVEAFISLEDTLIKESGLAPGVALVRYSRGPVRTVFGRGLWRFSQWSASRKWCTIRGETARADAWLNMAMHHLTR